MPAPAFDPYRFFDAHPAFLDSSETGPWVERLNARYVANIHPNRDLLEGARVLDLASHDGRFSYAALVNGAEHVVGIDIKPHLIETAAAHLRAYGIADDRFTFLVGDMYDCMDLLGPFDVVLCFGIFYHIHDHMNLLTRIADLDPYAVLIDTNVSQLDGAVIELRGPLGQSPPAPDSDVEGYPTPAALDAMLTSFGWTFEYFDWAAAGLLDREHVDDYRSGRRVSVQVTNPDQAVPVETRQAAVDEVLAGSKDRESEVMATMMVAQRDGFSARSLRTWMNRHLRDQFRERGFRP